jgi:hypothetical protein
MPFALLIMAGTVLLMLAGVLPAANGNAGIIFRSPVFAAVLGLLALSTLLCIIRKPMKFSSAGFHLVHIGVILIMIGGFTAFIAEKRAAFHISTSENPIRHLQISQNEVVDLGFSIHLNSFKVIHYPPDLVLLEDNKQIKTFRIKEGQTVTLPQGDRILFNKIIPDCGIESFALDGDPEMLIYENGNVYARVTVTGEVESIGMPDGGSLLVSMAYNNLPAMQSKNFKETDYPTNPGLILRLFSNGIMSILSLPANGRLKLLSAMNPADLKLPDIRYIYPEIKDINLGKVVTDGKTGIILTIDGKKHTLIQDAGMLSRLKIDENKTIQLSNPIDRQHIAEIEIDNINGTKRTAMLGTNHPVDEQGWRFYLNSYDMNGIIITARRDPGNQIVIFGILAIMTGMPLIFFFRKRRKN